jgi:hypothetical protein
MNEEAPAFNFSEFKTQYLGNIQDPTERETFQKNLEPIKDVQSLVTSYVHAQKAVGSKVNLPNEKSAPEEWDKLFNRLGRPENADGYEIETPDYKFDDNVLKEIKKAAHEAGLTKTQANKVIGSIAKMSREAMEVLESSKAAQLEAVKTERSKWEDLSTTETKVDLFLKQNTKNVEDYEKLKSLIDTDNNLFKFMKDVALTNTPKDIGQTQANLSAKETPEQVAGRILSDRNNFNDWYNNAGRNMPESVRRELQEAINKSNPKEIGKYIRN